MITLIGKNLAKKNMSFVFQGSAEECESCRFKATCIDSLEEGRKYVIKNIKDIEQKCNVHDGGLVQAVEVEQADIEAFIDSKKVFEGSTTIYNAPNCDIHCVFHDLCFPEGLLAKDKCTIVKDLGKHNGACGKDFSLSKVILHIE
ncbi:MAG: UPF0179 family protein [Methanobrevibacter sp.]|jgi:uncharacterized protein (UPF0179 family)|nr:UPF0179 family protein [Methanobrevibacter sp.]